MSRSQRDKGRVGEWEVAAIYRAAGLTVRGLKATGDHLIVTATSRLQPIHSEVKRQETARVWAWYEQAVEEAPPGTLPVVAFRRNRSPWLTLVNLVAFADLVKMAGWALEHGYDDGRA